MENPLNFAQSQTAHTLIQFYGPSAEKEAAEQAETCARRGAMEDSQNWNWIAKAISEIQSCADGASDAACAAGVS